MYLVDMQNLLREEISPTASLLDLKSTGQMQKTVGSGVLIGCHHPACPHPHHRNGTHLKALIWEIKVAII